MSKILWKLLLVTPAILGSAFATSASAQTANDSAIAQTNTLEQLSNYGAEGRG
ncbi:MAG: hypothetical protein IGS48_06490, partial [Oscillatoriales cyanobacterium C42_A2020_001]|nr:hypothetical protein [Leptolyngbyaceae cyanobacterium C42_A2020_001]